MIALLKKSFLNVPIYILALFIFSSFIFILFPEFDLYISSLFYDKVFVNAYGSSFEHFFYHSVEPIVLFTLFFSIAVFTYNSIYKKDFLHINKRVMLYIVLVVTIAPGLFVNLILKENWGRARPSQIVQFGGEKKFTPAFIISDQNGNSFSSGHAAAAFSLIGFALLARKKRKIWISLAMGYGILVSIARLSVGGHFLSDVVTSFFIVYITTLILYGLIIKGKT